MALLINLRLLEKENLSLSGKLTPAELELDQVDELIHVRQPLTYELEAQRLDKSVLVQGSLELKLDCECARCLKPFLYRILLPDWACLLALEGEEAVPVSNDCIDLTPFLREDILLEFPQHPLCKPDCGGLTQKAPGKTKKISQNGDKPSAWNELNKLKF